MSNSRIHWLFSCCQQKYAHKTRPGGQEKLALWPQIFIEPWNRRRDLSNKKRVKQKPKDDVLREVDAIKRLLTLLLLKIDTSQGEVAMALQLDQSEVSRMFPARNVTKLKFVRSA